MRELAQCRKEIDEIDRQLAALFEQRMAVCREVGAYKREHGLPVLDARRERELLADKAAMAGDPELAPLLTAFFENIMAGSRTLQERMLPEPDPGKAAELEAYEALRSWRGEPLQDRRVLYQGQPGPIARKRPSVFSARTANG